MELFDSYAPFYDLDYAGFDADEQLIQQLARRCGSPILELGCGTGRLLIPLAAAGYEVTGVDVSGAMLAIAEQKVADQRLGSRVILVEQDMRLLDLEGRRYHLAFAAINSFMHMMTVEDQLSALVRTRQHLYAGAILLLDLFNPHPDRLLDSQGQVVLEKVMTDPESGRHLQKFRTQTVDLAQQVVHNTVFVDEMNGEGCLRRTPFAYSLRYLFRFELELLVRQAGYQLEAVYGSYDLDEFSGESDKMIVLARVSEESTSI
jgi:SAM-dependent methyltransferase